MDKQGGYPDVGAVLVGRRPGRDIAIALLIKLVLLTLLYQLFFAPRHRPHQDAESAAAAVLGAPTTETR